MLKRTLPFFILLLTAFAPAGNEAIVKGRLKQVNHYMSGQRSNLYYDEQGRLKLIEDPYGVTWSYTYNANYIYRVWKDPRGYSSFDTMIEKGSHKLDSMVRDNAVFDAEYDLEGNMVVEKYTRTFGKKRKTGKTEFTYFYDYFPTKWDSVSSQALYLGCYCEPRGNLLKTAVGIDAKGDTAEYFTYRYKLDSTSRVITRMKYYRTGQLYDSIGYVYY